MKQLRKIHRDRFTLQVETEVKKDELIKERKPRPDIDYVPFRQWLRGSGLPERLNLTPFSGKALQIRHGA